MSDNHRLDDELAALTDSLLAGEPMEASDELHDLAYVVRSLHRTITPDTPPEPAFRARLTQRLIREWNLTHQRRTGYRWQNRPIVQITTLAAGVVLVFLVVLLLASQQAESTLEGVALNGSSGIFIVLAAGALVASLLLFVLWYRQHKR